LPLCPPQWVNFESAIRAFGKLDLTAAVTQLSYASRGLSLSLSECNVPALAAVVAKLAADLGNAPVATLIGGVVQSIVGGADVTMHLTQVRSV
jgi:hypothetical protein